MRPLLLATFLAASLFVASALADTIQSQDFNITIELSGRWTLDKQGVDKSEKPDLFYGNLEDAEGAASVYLTAVKAAELQVRYPEQKDCHSWLVATSLKWYGYTWRAVRQEHSIILPNGEKAIEVLLVLVKTEADMKAYEAGKRDMELRYARQLCLERGPDLVKMFIYNQGKAADQAGVIQEVYEGINP